jgi:hypothetical protein
VNKNSFTLPLRKQVKNLKYLACEISYENEKGLVNNIDDQLDATITIGVRDVARATSLTPNI